MLPRTRLVGWWQPLPTPPPTHCLPHAPRTCCAVATAVGRCGVLLAPRPHLTTHTCLITTYLPPPTAWTLDWVLPAAPRGGHSTHLPHAHTATCAPPGGKRHASGLPAYLHTYTATHLPGTAHRLYTLPATCRTPTPPAGFYLHTAYRHYVCAAPPPHHLQAGRTTAPTTYRHRLARCGLGRWPLLTPAAQAEAHHTCAEKPTYFPPTTTTCACRGYRTTPTPRSYYHTAILPPRTCLDWITVDTYRLGTTTRR